MWIGNTTKKISIDIPESDCLKILGIHIDNQGCSEKNWREKETIIIEELDKRKKFCLSYKTKIILIKSLVLSQILFLSCVYPLTEKWGKRINKLCCNFIWGTTREVTKRGLLFKPRISEGLGATDLILKTRISFCKIIAQGINRQVEWLGDITNWRSKKRES